MLGALFTLAATFSIAAAQTGDLHAELTTDGASNYLQVVDYDLQVRLDPAKKELAGEGTVTWWNRTAFPAHDLWWHLYLNAFSNDRSTFMRESGGKLRSDVFKRGEWGHIEVTRMELENGDDLLAAMKFEHPDDDNSEDRTVISTPLPHPVAPGASTRIKFKFNARLPKVFARSGWGGDFFMVGQWFPKLGVLEAGPEGARWNCHQYHATSEFFADYGHFKVAITVPRELEVGATGKRIATREESGGLITFVYEQDRVHDFAFTADRRFLRREREFSAAREVSPEQAKEAAALLGLAPEEMKLSDIQVTLLLQPEHAAYEDRYFRAVFEAIRWFGLWYGAYPYETLTVVDGPANARGAMGMEYPTLITGGVRWPAPEGTGTPEGVTVHEFGHQYWYGLVGSNEFEESWLDEGFNTYSTGKVLDRAYGPILYPPALLSMPLTPWFPNVRLDETEFARLATSLSATTDQVVRPAWMYRSSFSYGINSYPRTGLVLRQLERELGAGTAARAMRVYHLRWRWRHPKTADFIRTVEEVAGRSLEKFFQGAIFSPGAIDYAVTELTSERLRSPAGVFEGGKEISMRAARSADSEAEDRGEMEYETTVYVERKGEVAHPVNLEVHFEDGSVAREQWDGEYRWTRFRYRKNTRAEYAQLHPHNELVLDLDTANDSRARRSSARPGVTWGAHMLFVVQTLFQILGGWL